MGKIKMKPPPMGERVKIYTMDKIPEDFKSFLDKFSENFVNAQFGLRFQGSRFKVSRVKEKEKDDKFEKKTEMKHGMKMKQSEAYEKKEAKFKFEIANLEFYTKVYFEEVDSNMDVYFKYKVKGKGLIFKMIAKMMGKAGGVMLIQGTTEALKKTLESL